MAANVTTTTGCASKRLVRVQTKTSFSERRPTYSALAYSCSISGLVGRCSIAARPSAFDTGRISRRPINAFFRSCPRVGLGIGEEGF